MTASVKRFLVEALVMASVLCCAMTADAQPAFQMLHNFLGAPDDGFSPLATVIQASDGNFYGTTNQGGTGTLCTTGPGGCGTVFKMTADGTMTILHSFAGGADGEGPTASLLEGHDGNLYGTTLNGGNAGCSGTCGVVFRITKAGAYALVHSFVTAEIGGPHAALIQASDGNLYG